MFSLLHHPGSKVHPRKQTNFPSFLRRLLFFTVEDFGAPDAARMKYDGRGGRKVRRYNKLLKKGRKSLACS
jgi:hypothetical protein